MSLTLLATWIAVPVIALAVIAVAGRLIIGPSTADRIIATDMLGLIAVGLAALVAVIAASPAFIDVAFGLALVGFLTAIAFAGLMERAATRIVEPAE